MKETLQDALAKYVLELSAAMERTHRAEDRPIYQAYLADAAVLLALVASYADKADIEARVHDHERLWGQAWLQDPAYKVPVDAFGNVKSLLK